MEITNFLDLDVSSTALTQGKPISVQRKTALY
jgi:hypothetical protein